MKRWIFVGLIFIGSKAVPASAGELVFNFMSPSFGGSPMNGQWLMNYASAQNDFTTKPGEHLRDLSEMLKNVREATINIQNGAGQTQNSISVDQPQQ